MHHEMIKTTTMLNYDETKNTKSGTRRREEQFSTGLRSSDDTKCNDRFCPLSDAISWRGARKRDNTVDNFFCLLFFCRGNVILLNWKAHAKFQALLKNKFHPKKSLTSCTKPFNCEGEPSHLYPHFSRCARIFDNGSWQKGWTKEGLFLASENVLKGGDLRFPGSLLKICHSVL